MDKGGDFKIQDINIGKHKNDISNAKILVLHKDWNVLGEMLDELSDLGASISSIHNAFVEKSPKDKVVPENFYSTTNHMTEILLNGNWTTVENIEMDSMIVIKENRAICTPLSQVKKGDDIVVGREGIRVNYPQRPRGTQGVFEFMNSEVSTEKPLLTTIKNIATEIHEIKSRGGKIAIVGGPAIVHTGSGPILSALIRDGYIDVLFAGNALATHDIESALYGTSLGVKLETGEIVSRGHMHHMKAINAINKAGSIKDAVDQNVLKSGIMYECVKNNVPFVLAGSIRDDGPLPDVITDVIKAQNEMRKYTQKIDMILMFATMLHSIAVGNILPSRVKTIAVDVNPSTVTKLSDRGSAQAVSIVTDIGGFFPILYEELKKLE